MGFEFGLYKGRFIFCIDFILSTSSLDNVFLKSGASKFTAELLYLSFPFLLRFPARKDDRLELLLYERFILC